MPLARRFVVVVNGTWRSVCGRTRNATNVRSYWGGRTHSGIGSAQRHHRRLSRRMRFGESANSKLPRLPINSTQHIPFGLAIDAPPFPHPPPPALIRHDPSFKPIPEILPLAAPLPRPLPPPPTSHRAIPHHHARVLQATGPARSRGNERLRPRGV